MLEFYALVAHLLIWTAPGSFSALNVPSVCSIRDVKENPAGENSKTGNLRTVLGLHFQKSDWIGQQKAWAAILPVLRKIAAQYFLIPQTLEHDLVPSPYLPSPEALAGLRDLRTTNPALHAALSQTTETDPTSEAPDNGEGDDPYQVVDVYDDCDIPLAVVSDHLLSGGSSIANNSAVVQNGGIVQLGEAEISDAEEESDAPSSSKIGFAPFEDVRKFIVHSLGITVTCTKIVQFRGPRHLSPEPLVETLQYPQSRGHLARRSTEELLKIESWRQANDKDEDLDVLGS
ncbi:hypothetical protein B0H19DRAFT_1082364 [Mycena capillaripes]|nr:hypothetical protein B0H19DRAFT_1082364 [Mycena capillaripes]